MEIVDRINTRPAKELLKILEEPFHHQGNGDITRRRQAKNNQDFKLLATIWPEQWPKMGEKDAQPILFPVAGIGLPGGPPPRLPPLSTNALYSHPSDSRN